MWKGPAPLSWTQAKLHSCGSFPQWGVKPGPQTGLPSTEHQCWDHPPRWHPVVKSHVFLWVGGGVTLHRKTEPAGDRHFFLFFLYYVLKGKVTGFCILSHSPWAQAKGGQHSLESHEESLDWQAWGRGVREWLLGSPCQDITPYPSSHFSWEEQYPPRGKTVTPPCGKPLGPPALRRLLAPSSGILLAMPTIILMWLCKEVSYVCLCCLLDWRSHYTLWNPACPTSILFFTFFYFKNFITFLLSPNLHLIPCWGNSNTGGLRGDRDWL